jgi:hypothetical protein
MDKSLLNTKKIKLTVSTCDTNDTEETEYCANEAGTSRACPMVPMEQLPKNNGHFPNYWTKNQWRDTLDTYKWLTINRGGLGCSTCKSVGKLGPMKTKGLKLANEWVKGSAKEYGDTKEKIKATINYEKTFLP